VVCVLAHGRLWLPLLLLLPRANSASPRCANSNCGSCCVSPAAALLTRFDAALGDQLRVLLVIHHVVHVCLLLELEGLQALGARLRGIQLRQRRRHGGRALPLPRAAALGPAAGHGGGCCVCGTGHWPCTGSTAGC
jgi:hypothetical protein